LRSVRLLPDWHFAPQLVGEAHQENDVAIQAVLGLLRSLGLGGHQRNDAFEVATRESSSLGNGARYKELLRVRTQCHQRKDPTNRRNHGGIGLTGSGRLQWIQWMPQSIFGTSAFYSFFLILIEEFVE